MATRDPAPPRDDRTDSGTVPIRALDSGHRAEIVRHLLSLDASDRYLRFGYAATDEQIGRYAERLDFELRLVLRIHLDALGQPFARDRSLDIQRQLGDRPKIAPLEYAQHDEQRRHECEHYADQTKNRHPET